MSQITTDLTNLLSVTGPASRASGATSEDRSSSDFADHLSGAAEEADVPTDASPAAAETPAAEEPVRGQDEAADEAAAADSPERDEQVEDSESDTPAEATLVIALTNDPAPPVDTQVAAEEATAELITVFDADGGAEQPADDAAPLTPSTATDGNAAESADAIDQAEIELIAQAAEADGETSSTPVDAASAAEPEAAVQVEAGEAPVVAPVAVSNSADASTEGSDAGGPRQASSATAGEAQPDAAEGAATAPDRDGSNGQQQAASEEQLASKNSSVTDAGDPAQAVETAAEAESNEAVDQRPSDRPASDRPIDSPRSETSTPLTRLAAGRVPTTGVDAARGEEAGPRVDTARFVGRVTGAFQAAQERGGEVRLMLSPPELGALQIKLSVNEGALTATIETETATARNLLLDNLPALRDRLAEQEIRVEKFDVDVRQEGGQQQDWAPGEDRQSNNNQHGDASASATPSADDAAEASAAPDPTPAAPDSQTINLVV